MRVGSSIIQDVDITEKHGSVNGVRWNSKESLVLKANKLQDGK